MRVQWIVGSDRLNKRIKRACPGNDSVLRYEEDTSMFSSQDGGNARKHSTAL
jgi:hypothetical protein